ncbi:aldo/keto reductase [Streptomyces sp. SID3343]|uniref:aldo/keto reductase n=1 Tax=Streptomyces sp. SID3343 TaxID=2690260 RepID=UPI0013684634|nr:aldo/keto reductase [Streptomyces sp. SID3343]MYW00369.1 aldo/keto reductase [Streptomyces sp. SID3343]
MSDITVPRRRLGTVGPQVPVLSLGSWHTYDRMDFHDAVDMVGYAVESGIDLFDVAVYGIPGQPPVFTDVLFSAIVRAAGLARADYLLSTKVWLEGYPEQSLREQVERAMFRVGADHADLAILGDIRSPDLDLEQLAGDLADLERSGLIGHWGVNNWSAEAITTIRGYAVAAGSAGPQVAQLKYSPCRRSIADGAPFAELFSAGLSMQASDVLEGGILAGKVAPARQIGRDPGGVRERIVAASAGVAALAEELGATAAQVCVAFTLTHPATANVLFGASRREQLVENMGALRVLDRVGAGELRARLAPFWVDGDVVSPSGP